MAQQSSFYNADGTTRTYPSSKHIASKQHVAVYFQSVTTSTWSVIEQSLYELVNNSIVFTDAPDSALYSQIEIRVADTAAELTESPSDIAIVAGAIADISSVATDIGNVDTVATNIGSVNTVSANNANVTTVATNIASVVSTSGSIANVNTVAGSIANINTVASDLNEPISEINTVATDIANVNTVGSNINNVNTVAGISANVTTVAGNNANVTTVAGISGNVTTVAGISTKVTTVANNNTNVSTVAGISGNVTTVAGISGNVTTVAGISANVTSVAGNATNINSVATNIVPNLAEILLADTNAATATTKAAEASASAASALASELAATAIVTDPLKLAIGNINSPLLDMPLKNSLAMKAGVGSATFTRASTATYIDRYGVLKTAAVDEPRFEKEGYLNEGSSTNLNTYSEDTSISYSVIGATSVQNTNLAPDGNTTADKLLEDTSTGFHHLSKGIIVSAGVAHTGSRFIMKTTTETAVKMDMWNATDGQLAQVTFNPATGAVSSSSGQYALTDYGTYWRVSVTATPTVTSISNRLFLGGGNSYTGDGATYIIHWGYQLEALPFATSYIPTTSATVTRSADVLSVTNIGNVPNTNTSNPQMTLAVDFDSLGLTHTASGVLISQYATTSNYWCIRRYTSDTRIGVISESGDVVSYSFVAGSNNTMTKRRVVAVFNGTTLNFYSNGVLISTQTMATPLLTDSLLDKLLYIGSFITFNYLYGHISNVRIYDKALTAQEVALA